MSKCREASGFEALFALFWIAVCFGLLYLAAAAEQATHPPDKFDRIDSYSSDGTITHTYIPKR